MMRRLVLLLIGALSACAPSTLIKPGDTSYLHARARIRRTATRLESIAPSDDERDMFMQAESFYRYRFDPPPRSPGTYIAQIAAVAAELPALQALSGSLDLNEFRLKAYDGAVQLWESLLLQYPKS